MAISKVWKTRKGAEIEVAGKQLRIEMIKAIFKSGRVEYHLAIPSKSTDNANKKENPALHNPLAEELLRCTKEGEVSH